MKTTRPFENSLIDFVEAVTALANYTRALRAISERRELAAGGSRMPDDACAVDILEQIARQLGRASNGLRGLYECRGIAGPGIVAGFDGRAARGWPDGTLNPASIDVGAARSGEGAGEFRQLLRARDDDPRCAEGA